MGAALEAYAITHSMYAPNDIKVRAHHLHSGCTEDYVIALERLMSAADILAAMDQEDEDVKFLKDAQVCSCPGQSSREGYKMLMLLSCRRRWKPTSRSYLMRSARLGRG